MKPSVIGTPGKSRVNPNPPNVAEGRPHGASAPKTVPNRPDSTKNRVIQTEASTSKSKTATFSAPRKDGSMAPFDCGYTKPGKM